MSIATHNVVAPSPEAFAYLAIGPFCGAPAYGRESFPFTNQGLLPSVRRACARLRDSTLQTLEFFDTFTLMLLPKRAIYFGTRRNMIELSMCYKIILLQVGKSGNRVPAGTGFSSPSLKRGAFKPTAVIIPAGTRNGVKV